MSASVSPVVTILQTHDKAQMHAMYSDQGVTFRTKINLPVITIDCLRKSSGVDQQDCKQYPLHSGPHHGAARTQTLEIRPIQAQDSILQICVGQRARVMRHVCTAYSAAASTYAYDPQNQTAENQTAANPRPRPANPRQKGQKKEKKVIKKGAVPR
jgi:hypothetical protein